MADRYWVGGAGTWDATTTTNWSATSGGSGGASAPTSVDNVIFNSASSSPSTAYAVTIGTSATALNITIGNPFSGVVTFTGTNNINCYGSWTNAAGVVFSVSGNLNFLSATTGRTITTNGVSLGLLNVVPITVGGGWTLVGAFTCNVLSIQGGSFDTGSYNVTCVIFQSAGTAVRALTLGTSTITVSNAAPWVFSTTTGLTFSGASSTIICSASSATFAGGGLTYGTVNFTSTAADSITTISGANTYTDLNQTSPSSGRRIVGINNSNQTITGTLRCGAANAYNARVEVRNQSTGLPITLTVATIATLSDVDFRDITAAGASGTWSGTRLGNCLGNSNITFDAGKTVYWNLVAGGSWSANAWATSSGGAVATANFPLAQDTAIIEDTGLTAGNTITINSAWNIGTLNCTRTAAWTFAGTGLNIYLNFTITSVTTVTNSGNQNFLGRSTQTITTNGVSLAGGVSINNIGSTVVLNGNLTTPAASTVTLSTGTLDLAGFTLSTGIFSSSNTNTRTLAFGTGKIVLTGLNVPIWTSDTATNFSVTGTSRVEISGAGTFGQVRNIIAGLTGGTETNSPNFYVTAGADDINFNAAGRKYGTIDFSNGGTSTFNGSFQSGNWVFTVYGSLILTSSISGFTTSTSFSGPITFGSTSGTKSVTTAAQTYPVPLTFNGIGGTWLCADALTTSGALTLTNGTLQSGGYLITSSTFTSTGAGTRSLDLSNGSIILTGAGAAWTTSGTNFSAGANDVIYLNGASAQTFAGGGFTFGNLAIDGSGVKTITGNNTFFNIVNTVSPASVTFAASSTNTFSNFNLNGTSGNLVTLRSTVPGTQYTLVKV
jgi:hypothetical protein